MCDDKKHDKRDHFPDVRKMILNCKLFVNKLLSDKQRRVMLKYTKMDHCFDDSQLVFEVKM